MLPLSVAAQLCFRVSTRLSVRAVGWRVRACTRPGSRLVYGLVGLILLRVLGSCFEAIYRSRTRLSSVCSVRRVRPHPHRPGFIIHTPGERARPGTVLGVAGVISRHAVKRPPVPARPTLAGALSSASSTAPAS